MIYEKFEGNSASVCIENIDSNDPYIKIGAKAFLSCKNVYEIKLPDTIDEIGAWAFAHMKELKKIIVPARKMSIGKDAFLDCDSLKEVAVYPDNSNNSGLSFLLASCITVLKANDLLDFEMVSEQGEAWYELYDRELINYIHQSDDRGFQPVIVGWFNDEGEEEQLSRYIKKVRADKINLSFLRLKYDSYIENSTKESLLEYLRTQINQSDSSDNSTWRILRDILADDIQYVKLAVTNELLSDELKSELIRYLNNKNASTEIVAYLVQSIRGNDSNIDAQFEL